VASTNRRAWIFGGEVEILSAENNADITTTETRKELAV
jgi:hypothetical protein